MIFIFNIELFVHFQISWYVSSTVHLVGVYHAVDILLHLLFVFEKVTALELYLDMYLCTHSLCTCAFAAYRKYSRPATAAAAAATTTTTIGLYSSE